MMRSALGRKLTLAAFDSGGTHEAEVNLMLVEETLSALRSECELCGRWSGFTGRVEQNPWGTSMIVRCPQCRDDFSVYDPRSLPLLQTYLADLTQLSDVSGYRAALAILRGGSLQQLAELMTDVPAEMPLFGIEDVNVPASLASGWAELLYTYNGWRPLPTSELRLRELLAAAVQFDRVDLAEKGLAALPPTDALATYDHLRRRFFDCSHPVLQLLKADDST